MNPGDGDVLGGLRREWQEEVIADFEPSFEAVGLLNDDTTPVGQVHLGLVYLADAAGRPVAIREVDKLSGSFEPTARVREVQRGDGDVELARSSMRSTRPDGRRRAVMRAFLLALGVTIPGLGPRLRGRVADRILDAPRRTPEEAALGPALDALGGEVVRLRSRDGVRLAGALAAGRRVRRRGRPDGDWVADPYEAILLLHGWTGSVAPDLVEYGPFLRRTAGVLGLDFRGHGGSDDAPTTFGLREVEDVAGALDWLGERGIRRVALVRLVDGRDVAIDAVAVLGDGSLAAADRDPYAPAAT